MQQTNNRRKRKMNIEKVYYNGKCIMTVDMDYIDRDSVNYEYLQEILGGFQ